MICLTMWFCCFSNEHIKGWTYYFETQFWYTRMQYVSVTNLFDLFFSAGYGQKIVIPISQFLNQNMCNKIIVSMTLTSIPTSHRVTIYKVNKRNQVRARCPSFLQMKWLTTIYMILIEICFMQNIYTENIVLYWSI